LSFFKFDNGLLFCDMGGFEIIMKELNSTQDKELQMQAALVLGASMQRFKKMSIKLRNKSNLANKYLLIN